MRKNAAFMMLTLLLLIVPALANAWTLTVKVAGGTAAQAVTADYSSTSDLAVHKTLKVGTNYLYPKAGATFTAAGAPSFMLDGIAKTDLAALNAATSVLTSGPHTVTVTYTPAGVNYGGLTITQAPGGTIYARNLNNTWSNASVAGYVEDALIPVTIAADGNNKIKNYTVGGETTAFSGKVKSIEVAAGLAQTVTAEFEVDAKVSAALFAPTNAVAGPPVTLSVAATTNDTGLQYAFSTDDGANFTTWSATASYSFTPGEGTTKVQAKVKSANSGTVEFLTPVAAIVVANAQVAANSECASCHSSQPAGTHGYTGVGITCTNCHSSAPHSTTAVITHASGLSCAGCHTGVNSAFTTSQHGTRQGKLTWYGDNLGNTEAVELQKGFGNYVNVAYAALPCGKCHNAAAWTPAGGTDQWSTLTGGKSVCVDCHGNRAANAFTTAVTAPVTKATCFGCHSRQANEASAGLTDVHFATMGCSDCHSTADMHGTGSQTASQLVFGTISAQCENCHGEGKARGPISAIAAHLQHADDIACSTCHAESMITCHNCHFDNEAGAGGALKAKFFSGKFGGTMASGNSWRFLVNRVMPDGSTKIYPGSMQSLVADFTVDGANDAQGHTHAGIAPYYSHTITRVNALSCDKCHGTETAVKLAAGEAVRVTTWKAEAGVSVPAASVATTFVGPKGVIPVPENPRGKLLMDFVDLTDPTLGTASPRVLFQKDGPDTIHMPEAFVKPLTAAQMQKLAAVQFDHTSPVASATPVTGYSESNCNGCHTTTNGSYATSQHFTKNGKATWFNDHLGNEDPGLQLQTGFGTYVSVGYDELPCKNCHNGGDNGPWDSDSAAGSNTQVWPGANCTECHTNRTTYGVQSTTADAPVAKATCLGCHSRQKKEAAPVASGGAALVDVHTNGVDDDGDTQVEDLTCMGCHSLSDMHGTGTQTATQLQWGTITAQCENCHGTGKTQGVVNASVPEHDALHLAKIACSTCHLESMVTCNNCHFDNEMGGTGIRKLKFASGFFGGLHNADPALSKSWRYLVNRVMPDGSTKVYPGSMQSLYTDVYAKNAPGSGAVAGQGDDTGWAHAGIAPYYSHSITKVNALKCDKCHGIQAAIDLNSGTPIRVVTWTGTDTETVAPSALGTKLSGPKGVIPVPENPKGKLLMDFVDLVDPNAALNATSDNLASPRKLAQRNGPDSIHMPEAYVRPLTAAQINKLATPQARP